MNKRHAILRTQELGELTLVAAGDELAGIYFPGHWTRPDRASFGPALDIASDPVLSEAARQIREYLQGERTEFDLATAAAGDGFAQRVWALLREIPFGETTTYGELADALGTRDLARRVGQAVGRNPLSIVVPCHRVLGKDGALRGYAGGLERKQILLELEGSSPGRTAGPTARASQEPALQLFS